MEKERILETLRFVIDPEIGVNIVDLGLVYDIEVEEDTVNVEMTMTTPMCPMHTVITRQAKSAIRTRFPKAEHVNIDLVWDPPWEAEMMSDEAKQTLGWS